MNDIINELRQPVATSFEPDQVEHVVTEMYRRGLKAADLIEQQQKQIAELEAKVANAEQRTAEACAKASEELRHPDGYSGENQDWCDGTQHAANAIRNSKWRGYL